MFRLFLFGLCSLLAAPFFSFADEPVTVLRRERTVVPIKNCEAKNICDLKQLIFIVEDYKVGIPQDPDGYHFGTRVFAGYETATFDTLEKYVFVQFIRGSVYYSRRNDKTGAVELRPPIGGISTKSFGWWIEFTYPLWTIDSDILDPNYYGEEGSPRHYLYEWWDEGVLDKDPYMVSKERFMRYRTEKKKSKKFEPRMIELSEFIGVPDRQGNLYGEKTPSRPALFVRDSPDQAWIIGDGIVKNVSLEFKMCLFKAIDVPTQTTRDNINFAEPIYCFPWRSSFVYNHELKKFESPQDVIVTWSNDKIKELKPIGLPKTPENGKEEK